MIFYANDIDRPLETSLVECKAKSVVISDDIKSFSFDLLVSKKARFGFFIHTSELQHQASGLVEELKQQYPEQMFFWGPSKVIDLLRHQKLVKAPPEDLESSVLTPTKLILIYSHFGRYWLKLYSNHSVPTHYQISDATDPTKPLNADAIKSISELDDVQGLQRLINEQSIPLSKPSISFDTVAEIQEADEWDDYRPVGTKFFVGRNDIRNDLYQFIQTVANKKTDRRVFFIEGKSGWGKSSLVAELRSRSRNKRNKNSMFVFAIDSRGANSNEFVSLSFAKMALAASKIDFIPKQFSELNLASSLDILASENVQELIKWLEDNGKTLIVIFDQFEDVFRKEDLFRAFHKLMLDVHEQQGPLVVGFSWKSEIYIPIDNSAYSLWQQARSVAESFTLEEFLVYDVDRVLNQLETLSGQSIPIDLRRRLKDLQRFPWLIKKGAGIDN